MQSHISSVSKHDGGGGVGEAEGGGEGEAEGGGEGEAEGGGDGFGDGGGDSGGETSISSQHEEDAEHVEPAVSAQHLTSHLTFSLNPSSHLHWLEASSTTHVGGAGGGEAEGGGEGEAEGGGEGEAEGGGEGEAEGGGEGEAEGGGEGEAEGGVHCLAPMPGEHMPPHWPRQLPSAMAEMSFKYGTIVSSEPKPFPDIIKSGSFRLLHEESNLNSVRSISPSSPSFKVTHVFLHQRFFAPTSCEVTVKTLYGDILFVKTSVAVSVLPQHLIRTFGVCPQPSPLLLALHKTENGVNMRVTSVKCA